MKIKQITETSTTAGSIAPVQGVLGSTQTRGNPSIYGGKKVGNLFKGKTTSKPYANSLNEAAMKDLSYDLEVMKPAEFQKKYGKSREEVKAALSRQPKPAQPTTPPINEADLSEQDLIMVPGQGKKLKPGFISKADDRTDHEVEMARSDLFQSAKNAKKVYSMIKDVGEDEGLEGWVQEKIIKANDYLNTVREYLEGKQTQGVAEGSGGNWYIRVNGKILNDTKFKPMIFSSEDEARSYAMKLADKKRIPLSQIKLTKSWMDAPEQGVAEGLGKDIKRLATGKDVKSRAGQEIAKSQDASMKGDTKTSKKHFDRFDKLDKLANKEQGVAEGYQLDEGAVETITALVKKIPGIGKYYQMAQQYKPQLIQILKTSKSGKEVKQKMEQLAASQSVPVAESGMMKQLGGLAVGGGSILSTMWMNAMGMIDGVLAHAAAGEVGGAVASGSILGLIPVTLMLFAAMLLFKGSQQSSDEKAQAFQAQRGQQGVAEGKRNLKCVCKTHGTLQCPVHTPKDIDVLEGAKVDRMVKHVAKSEKKLGHSKKEAENIAWATANKRGMLDNKNKKA